MSLYVVQLSLSLASTSHYLPVPKALFNYRFGSNYPHCHLMGNSHGAQFFLYTKTKKYYGALVGEHFDFH